MKNSEIIEKIVLAYFDKDVDVLRSFIKTGHCRIQGTQLVLTDELLADSKALYEFWDQKQYIRKLNLNSLYGILLSIACRFYDVRLGQSTTLTGRNITKHMLSTINKLVTGKYDHTGETVIYGDTDSAYFSAYKYMQDNNINFDWTNKQAIIDLYDQIADETNATFSDFLEQQFNVPKKRAVIKAGREAVGSKGIFNTKKRYALMVVDEEGKRYDKDGAAGKIKVLGLELKRSDTPKTIQVFLESVLKAILTNGDEKEIMGMIKEFRIEFRKWPSWEKGTPKKVNALTDYSEKDSNAGDMKKFIKLNEQLVKAKGKDIERLEKELEKLKKVNMPGHVRASLNWNKLRAMHNDNYSMPIQDGQKIIVCKLKNNPMGFTSIAYPTDEQRIPDWFKELPFDDEEMERTLIDSKVENLIISLIETEKWDIRNGQNSTTFDDLFSDD